MLSLNIKFNENAKRKYKYYPISAMYSAWQSLPWCCKTVCRLFHQRSSICTLCCHTYSGGGQPVRMGMYPDISRHLENRLRHAGCSSVLRMIKLSFTASGNWHELDRAIILLIRRQPEFLRPYGCAGKWEKKGNRKSPAVKVPGIHAGTRLCVCHYHKADSL